MSISKKQKTLFESWKCSLNEQTSANARPKLISASDKPLYCLNKQDNSTPVIDLCDDLDDVDLLNAAVAVEQTNKSRNLQSFAGKVILVPAYSN